MKKIISIVLCALLAISLASCSAVSENGEESERWTIRGRYCEDTNGTSLLLSDEEGAICITPAGTEDLFDDLENGDEIEISVDGVAETYPVQATVYSYTLIEKGTVENLDAEEIQDLETLGWEFSFEVEIIDESSEATEDVKANRNVFEDVIGKTFIYEGEGLQGDDFTITFDEYTFSYSEGIASSHLGFGTWSIEGNMITLTESDPEIKNNFEIGDDQLIWLEKDSDNFTYVKLTDGEAFLLEK
jgi:hypothetical protein